MSSNLNKKLHPGVSVVVCCYNSSDVIAYTMKALRDQDVPRDINYEVILVDNNCTDPTVKFAKSIWGDYFYPLRIVKEKKPGLIHARKTGVLQSRYDILLFVDDDNILNPDWVRKLYHLFNRMPKVVAIGGNNKPLFQGMKPNWFDDYKYVYACGPRDIRTGLNPKKIFGSGVAFRTQVLKSVLFSDLPLFLVGRERNILTRGEDTEISLRCLLEGWNFYYDSALKLNHYLLAKRVTWDYVCQARKGGGVAGIVLIIYRKLLNNREQLCFKKLLFRVLKQWIRYFLQYRSKCFQIKKEGSSCSFQFFRLYGMSKGLLLYRKTYANMQGQIIEFYNRK
jgi:glycosyltransferase involved in cell wall biosynthesis